MRGMKSFPDFWEIWRFILRPDIRAMLEKNPINPRSRYGLLAASLKAYHTRRLLNASKR